MGSLEDGEEFERDISNIMAIIDGVESSMSQKLLSQQFTRTTNLRNTRRALDMGRTLTAQQNYQQKYSVQ